jgi:hypothetical protein
MFPAFSQPITPASTSGFATSEISLTYPFSQATEKTT